MCFQEFSVVLIVLGVHNIGKRVRTTRMKNVLYLEVTE